MLIRVGTRIFLSLSLLYSLCLSLSLFCILSVSLTRSLLSDRVRQFVVFFCTESPASGDDEAHYGDASDADTACHRGEVTSRAIVTAARLRKVLLPGCVPPSLVVHLFSHVRRRSVRCKPKIGSQSRAEDLG